MQSVLDNRPYHFAKWMVILQQWEPNISPEFPSQIPFWIEVQDVPVHLWNEAILEGIGKDIGIFECWEITPAKARLKDFINGLRPLMFTSTQEFANGDEVAASLVYEKLEKYCNLCFMLDHEKEDCPLNKTQMNLKNTTQEINTRRSREHSTSLQKNTILSWTGSKEQDYRQPSGFMRDARKPATGYPSTSPRRNYYGNDSYEGSRRFNRDAIATRQEYPHKQLSGPSRPHTSHRNAEPRWVDTERRLAPMGYSRSRETQHSASANKDCNPPGGHEDVLFHKNHLDTEASSFRNS